MSFSQRAHAYPKTSLRSVTGMKERHELVAFRPEFRTADKISQNHDPVLSRFNAYNCAIMQFMPACKIMNAGKPTISKPCERSHCTKKEIMSMLFTLYLACSESESQAEVLPGCTHQGSFECAMGIFKSLRLERCFPCVLGAPEGPARQADEYGTEQRGPQTTMSFAILWLPSAFAFCFEGLFVLGQLYIPFASTNYASSTFQGCLLGQEKPNPVIPFSCIAGNQELSHPSTTNRTNRWDPLGTDLLKVYTTDTTPRRCSPEVTSGPGCSTGYRVGFFPCG